MHRNQHGHSNQSGQVITVAAVPTTTVVVSQGTHHHSHHHHHPQGGTAVVVQAPSVPSTGYYSNPYSPQLMFTAPPVHGHPHVSTQHHHNEHHNHGHNSFSGR